MSTLNLKLVLFIFFTICATFISTAQLSSSHWIPPVHSMDGNGLNQQFLYLSTPEATPFTVTITDGAENPIPGSPFTLSNANPVIVDLGIDRGTLVATELVDLNKPLSIDRGLLLSGSKPFYANLRFADASQAGNISSKGRLGLGNEFRLGSFPHGRISTNINGFFASVMASEDNTLITFDDFNTNIDFEDDAGVFKQNNITVTLNAGESYVVAGKYNTIDNLDGFIGARVRSDKPIAVNTGSMLGATPASGGQDMGIDQIVGLDLVGTEYIAIRGNGRDSMENVMVVATADNTEIFINGDVAPIATINAGDYYVVDAIHYTGVAHKNMYIETSEPIYLYQILGGDYATQTQGMSFIPPLSCNLLPKIDLIPNLDEIGAKRYTGGVVLTARTGAWLTINGNIVTDAPEAVTGNLDWVSYRLTGLSGNIVVESDGPVTVGLFGASGAAGYAGFYSGFGVETQDEAIFSCTIDAPFNIFDRIVSAPLQTGVWTPNFASGTNIFDPAIDTSDVYVYTLPNDCSVIEIAVTIRVDVPVAGAVTGLILCDNDLDGIETFDFSTAVTEALAAEIAAGEDPNEFSVTFHNNTADLATGANDLGTSYLNTSLTETIHVRVAYKDTNLCYSSEEFDIQVVQVTANPMETSTFDCNVTSVTIEANAATTYTGIVDFSYTWSTNNGNIISTTNTDVITVDTPGTYSVQVKENTTGCIRTEERIIAGIFSPPVAVQPADMVVCDDDLDNDDTNGLVTFDLSTNDAIIIGTNTGTLTVTYFNSLADANANTNSIATPSTYNNVTRSEEIFVRLSNVNPSCYDITSFFLQVNEVTSIDTEPMSVIECAGTTTSLSVTASGGVDGLTYQWQSSATSGNGFIDIIGATNATYDASTATIGTSYYRVIVSDTGTNCGSVTSIEAEVTVNQGATISNQPISVTECIGVTTTLSVTASGTGLTYQWQSSATSTVGFTDITGEIGTTYNAPTTTEGKMYYRVKISDAGAICGTINSMEAEVIVSQPITIDTEPVPVTECAGTTTSLIVAASGGVDGLTYQWQSSATSINGFIDIIGATNATYDASTATIGTNYYRVIVSDTGTNCGSVTSLEAEVTVNQGATISNQPISVTECIGVTTTLSVTASGTGLTYQWQSSATSTVGFTDISGETGTTYNAPTTSEGKMYYRVRISDAGAICGTITSLEAEVIVNQPITIDTEPVSVTECAGTTTSLNVIASGGVDGLTYQWQSSATSINGFIDVVGATNDTYDASTATIGTSYYRVIVSDTGTNCGSVTSIEAEVTVNQGATISNQPISVTECIGTTATTSLSVVAFGGVDGLTYQWQSSATSGNGFIDIVGATNTTYDAPTTAVGTTYYQVVVSDSGTNCGDAFSNEVNVTVNALPVVNYSSLTACDLDTDDANASFDGIATFDLTAANEFLTSEDSTTLAFEFYESQNDIDTNNPIVNITAYRNTIAINQTLLVVVTNGNGCTSTANLALEVFETISSENMDYVNYACDENPSDTVLEGFFNLEEIRAQLYAEASSTFYASFEDAENNSNSISGTDYFSTDATIYVAIADVNGCDFIKTFELSVLAPPSVLDEEEINNCNGDTEVHIEAPLGNDFYNWYFTKEDGTEVLVSTERELITSVSGDYRLYVENEFNSGDQFLVCENESFFNLTISEPATITNIDVIDFSNENSIEVNVEGIGAYEYALNNGSFQDGNKFNDVPPGEYIVTVRDKNGCGEVSETFKVYGFPKFFTPNGDGIHEVWSAENPPVALQGSPVAIFDRYGKLLYQFLLGQEGWDGFYINNQMPSSDYWYAANLNDGRVVKGHFSIKR